MRGGTENTKKNICVEEDTRWSNRECLEPTEFPETKFEKYSFVLGIMGILVIGYFLLEY